MKNIIKLIGFTALVAVIGLTMIACDDSGAVAKSITITGISGLTGEGELWISPDADGQVMTAGGEVTISGSSVTVNLFTYDNDEYEYTTTAYTGSGSFYVFIGADEDWYVTKAKKSISAANTTIPWADFKEAEW
ncbi:MAG: hypothetical protein LBQ89_02690 [Treponema sp.]|jgi:hypothetical protein|nr:hypothetical protein [Treponema sp.]